MFLLNKIKAPKWMLCYSFLIYLSIAVNEVLFFSQLTTTTGTLGKLIRFPSAHLPRILLAQRRAKALLNNGIIQSLPSAGFGFYVPSLRTV
ncbi:hypothetical protein WR51_12130 [Bacillus cereus]|nr:hypothetical protein WR47_12120 [Bacillus cereus]ANC13630.1 hypothetical protein WR51_12130 [Bacillus cereus]